MWWIWISEVKTTHSVKAVWIDLANLIVGFPESMMNNTISKLSADLALKNTIIDVWDSLRATLKFNVLTIVIYCIIIRTSSFFINEFYWRLSTLVLILFFILCVLKDVKNDFQNQKNYESRIEDQNCNSYDFKSDLLSHSCSENEVEDHNIDKNSDKVIITLSPIVWPKAWNT